MLLDLRGLFTVESDGRTAKLKVGGKRGSAFSSAKEFVDFKSQNVSYTGELRLRAAEVVDPVSISGSLIHSIEIEQKTSAARVSLLLPNPFRGQEPIRLQLACEGADSFDRAELSKPSGWYTNQVPLAGGLNAWLQGSRAGADEVKRASMDLARLGIAESFGWPANTKLRGRAGVFSDENLHELALTLLIASEPTTNYRRGSGIRLFGLKTVDLYWVDSHSGGKWTCRPVALVLALGSQTEKLQWRAIVDWSPIQQPGFNPSIGRLKLAHFLEWIWNEPVYPALWGVRVDRGAAPLVAAPLIRITDSVDKVKDQEDSTTPRSSPILIFDTPSTSARTDNEFNDDPARLRRVIIRGAPRKILATYHWQADAIRQGGNPNAGPPALRPMMLQLACTLKPGSSETMPPDSNAPAVARFAHDASRLPGTSGSNDVVFDELLDIDAVRSPKPDARLTWGSLEFRFPDPGNSTGADTKAKSATRGTLRMRLRGYWRRDSRDLYPETDLRLTNVQVRVSSARDLANGRRVAMLDSEGLAEDVLQRESDALLHFLGAHALTCELRIRHMTQQGRDAVTRLEVYSTSKVGNQFGDHTLYLQPRPFLVAVTAPSTLDPEAGDLIATWSSDDPEGPQWRMPDATVEVRLPPQAVGEVMERGVRFWHRAGDQPRRVVDPEMVLPFRFSRPTLLTVRPSVRDRRYNRSPVNLAAVLDNAKVQSFTTELAYPIETSFEVSERGLPDIRILETGRVLGQPSPNLPLPPVSDGNGKSESEAKADFKRHLKAFAQGVFSGAAADYVVQGTQANAAADALRPLRNLRWRHAANRASFVARLAQHHLVDPWRADGALALTEGLRFRIRDTTHGAAPLVNPLPRWALSPEGKATPIDTDLSTAQKQAIHVGKSGSGPRFLADTAAGGNVDWAPPGGASIPAGIVHTMEFASELVAVLSSPTSEAGAIDRLAFTALGATGSFRCSFDEGRTVFIAESQHGQLSRLVKVRIGRLAVLHLRARHVVVYERSTVASTQFRDEQEFPKNGDGDHPDLSRGWPILRKTEEYIEPIELVRSFGDESQKDSNHAAFIAGCECVSQRIHVNSAWGRDLGHGYEIPLWNPHERSGFYARPQLALRALPGDGSHVRLWLTEPEHLYFYSNTERGAGGDPDRWEPKSGVDCPPGLHRLPYRYGNTSRQEVLDAPLLPGPRRDALRRPRFDLATEAEGQVNLQHGRGETPMLFNPALVTLVRSESQAAQDPQGWQDVASSLQVADAAAAHASLVSLLEGSVKRFLEQVARAPGECKKLKREFKAQVDEAIDRAMYAFKGALASATFPASGDLNFSVARNAVNALTPKLDAMQSVVVAPISLFRADVVQLRDRATEAQGDFKQYRTVVAGQIDAWLAQIDALEGRVEAATESASALLTVEDSGDLEKLLVELTAAVTAVVEQLEKGDPGKAEAALAEIEPLLRRLAGAGELAKIYVPGLQFVSTLRRLLTELDLQNLPKNALQKIATAIAPLKSLTELLADTDSGLAKVLTSYMNSLAVLKDGLEKLKESLSARKPDSRHHTFDSIRRVLDAFLAELDSFAAPPGASNQQVEATTLAKWRKQANDAHLNLSRRAALIDDAVELLLRKAAGFVKDAVDWLDAGTNGWIARTKERVICRIYRVDCKKLQATVAKVRDAIRAAEDGLRGQVASLATEVFDQGAMARMEKLHGDMKGLADKAGAGIKLVKALGDLPKLPSLTFNAERAEYFFEDAEKAIKTSPFAAKLREIDAGLKDLGLAVPARKLLDRIVPDSLDGLDFNKVFRNVGGIDFQGLLKRFRLPKIPDDRIQVTHGIDRATRTAWAKVKVDAQFAERQELFELASFALVVEKLKVYALTEQRVGLTGGGSSSVTDGRFTSDWGLRFSGVFLAWLREVTVKYDGRDFDFDFSPDKLELHPSLKFLSEVTSKLKSELPPELEFVKAPNGRIVGMQTTITNRVPPINAGALAIGPMNIVAGLGLQVGEKGRLALRASISVGSRQEPVWVQIGYLGGGLWLEARAGYADGRVTYAASLGLALGSARSFDLGGVARGSFALLLFAYADFDSAGGALRAGFSVSGSARILGIANASVFLLLEVEHRSGGGSMGRGQLDVKIRISRFYKVHVRRGVEKRIGG